MSHHHMSEYTLRSNRPLLEVVCFFLWSVGVFVHFFSITSSPLLCDHIQMHQCHMAPPVMGGQM